MHLITKKHNKIVFLSAIQLSITSYWNIMENNLPVAIKVKDPWENSFMKTLQNSKNTEQHALLVPVLSFEHSSLRVKVEMILELQWFKRHNE